MIMRYYCFAVHSVSVLCLFFGFEKAPDDYGVNGKILTKVSILEFKDAKEDPDVRHELSGKVISITNATYLRDW